MQAVLHIRGRNAEARGMEDGRADRQRGDGGNGTSGQATGAHEN
jgi:hypothetical protein